MTSVAAAEETVEPRLDPLASPRSLRGVGPALAERLAAAGIRTIADLLAFFPRRHEEIVEIDAPRAEFEGRLVRLRGSVVRVTRAFSGGGGGPRRSVVYVHLLAGDATPFRVAFFNQPYLLNAYPTGTQRTFEGILVVAGKPARFALERARALPESFRPTGSVVLRYPEIDGISSERLRGLIAAAIERVDWSRPWFGVLPAELRSTRHALLGDPRSAVCAMHSPRDLAEHEAARAHFALLEAVELFRELEGRRRARTRQAAPRIVIDAGTHAARIAAIVPFAWTADQEAAVAAIRRGLAGPAPLACLLHGDVGTGKTAVAIDAAIAVIDAGQQVALLAPTELLAEQHFNAIDAWLERARPRVRTALLQASLAPVDRRRIASDLAAGEIQFVIGTHALLTASTRFARLGLVLIDEQHRFGVAQRESLVAKGKAPHVLYLTATPIPRTLAWTLFGDLDVLALRTRPPGRRLPRAVFVARDAWPRIVRAIERHVRRGGQVYVVCPRVGAAGEKAGAVRLAAELSAHVRCALVHGRQPTEERQASIAAFRARQVPVLVGTSVLEVGIDVADATLIVIVGAERFGLASLHQLRGRVGRGARRGLCILSGTATERTAAVCRTTDGFELAEIDLRLRGAGELLGARQSGAIDFKALEPLEDLELLRAARDAVRNEP